MKVSRVTGLRFHPGPFAFFAVPPGQTTLGFIPRISRDHRLRAAFRGIRLHIRETPATSVSAGQPRF